MDSGDTTAVEQNGQSDPGKEEEVEDILIEVLGSRTQPAHILVKWRGAPVSEASWVPANVMNEEVRAWWAAKKARIASGELPEFDLDAWELKQRAGDQSMSTTHTTMTGAVENNKPVGLCPAEDGKHDEEDVSPARRPVPASRNKGGKKIIDSDDSDVSMHSDSSDGEMPLIERVSLSTPMLDGRRRSSLVPSTPNTVIGDTLHYLRHGSPEVQQPPPARKQASVMKAVLTAVTNLEQKLNDTSASTTKPVIETTANLKRKLSNSSATAELAHSSKKLAGPNGKKVERSPQPPKHKTTVVPSKTSAAIRSSTVAFRPTASTKKRQLNKDAKGSLPRKDHRFWRKQQDRPPNPADKVVGIVLTTKVLPNIDVVTRRQQEELDNIIVSPPAPRKRKSTGKLTKPTMLTEHTAAQQLEQARKSSVVSKKVVKTKAVNTKAVSSKAVTSKATSTEAMSTKAVSAKATTSPDTGDPFAPATEVESTLFVPLEPDAEAFIVQAQDRMATATLTPTKSCKASSALVNKATLTSTRSPTTSSVPATKATLIISPSKNAVSTQHSAKVQFVQESDTAEAKNESVSGRATVIKGTRAVSVSMSTRLPNATAIEHSTFGASVKGSGDGHDQTKTLEQKARPQLPAANGITQHFLPPTEPVAMRNQCATAKPGDIHPVYRRRSPGRERRRSVSSPPPQPPQAAVSRTLDPFKVWAKEKETTCRAWRSGLCKRDELSCKHRHALLPDKAFPMASQEITCSYWLQQDCYRLFCPFAHYDTGVHAMRTWSENQRELRQIFASAPPSIISSLMSEKLNPDLSSNAADESGVQSSSHTSTTMTDGSAPTTMVTRSRVSTGRAASTLNLARSMTDATLLKDSTQTEGTRALDTVELPSVEFANHVLAMVFKHKGPVLSTFMQQGDQQLRLSMQLCYASQREYTRAADALGDWDRGQLYLYEEAVIEKRLFEPYEPLGYIESCSPLVAKHLAEHLAAPAGQSEISRVRAAVIKYDNGFVRIALGDDLGYQALGIRPLPCAWKRHPLLFRVFTTQRSQDDHVSSLFSNSAAMLVLNLEYFFPKNRPRPSVCIFAANVEADGPVLLSNILKAGGVLVTIQNNAHEVNGSVHPDAFFLFSYETRYDKIPGLYKHLASQRGHTLTLRDWRIDQAPPELLKVFPNAVAILITDEVFSRPATVLEIFESVRALASPDNKHRLEKRHLLSPQILTTTDLAGLLKSLAAHDHDERHRKVLGAAETLTRDGYRCTAEKPWTKLVAKEEHDKIRSEPGRASNLFVTEFAQWAVRHAGEMGRFIVIHEPDAAGREDPRRWMDQFGHLEVMSPERWLRSARQEM